MTRQRDKAAAKAKRHGTWRGTHRAQRKHRAAVIKRRRRALRREGRLETTPGDNVTDTPDPEREAAEARFNAATARGADLLEADPERFHKLAGLVDEIVNTCDMEAAIGLLLEALEPGERLAEEVRIAATTEPPSWYQREGQIRDALARMF